MLPRIYVLSFTGINRKRHLNRCGAKLAALNKLSNIVILKSICLKWFLLEKSMLLHRVEVNLYLFSIIIVRQLLSKTEIKNKNQILKALLHTELILHSFF